MRANNFGLKEMLVQLAVTIGCSKGADGIGGMLRALESSGNSQLVSALQTWAKRNFQIKTDDDSNLSEPKKGTPAVQSPPRKQVLRNLTSSTELSLANPPIIGPTATGLFAATLKGLIALDLRTLEATALTSEDTLAVAVNHQVKKGYWSEGALNSRIMRSNFDASAQEIIVPQTGDSISTLAIDEPSGNVYFALLHSHEITVCNALGGNCAPVISNSSLVNYPLNIALDSENGFMYWGNRPYPDPHSLVRANLDGSNAAIIATGFQSLNGITLDQHSNDVLYWADYQEYTIGSIDVNGGNKRTLVKFEGNPVLWGLQVDGHKICFSEYSSKLIHTVVKGSGKELTTIYNSTGKVRQMALFNVPA